MGKAVTFVAVTPDGELATRTSRTRVYTHARWIDYRDGKGQRIISWHMTEAAAGKSLPPVVRERGLVWGIVPVTVDGEAPQRNDAPAPVADVTPEPAPVADAAPLWFAHTSNPNVFHLETKGQRARHAACAVSTRMRSTQVGVPSAEMPASGIRCRFCLDVAAADVPQDAPAIADEAPTVVTTIKTVGMTTVGKWFGYSKAAVSQWRKNYPNTPTPNVEHEGSPGWLPSRQAEWRRWYETEGPGRPAHLKPAHTMRRNLHTVDGTGTQLAAAFAPAINQVVTDIETTRAKRSAVTRRRSKEVGQ
ncbi:hypothetical protein [Lentzea kentuckyensis]|uniref:hypothetical protein n=1 Tax=Lentzea kentuckyensis TaxID=360086 RepID=UPI000A37BAE2|nr:hypothetical protein [Lentzea kentuckyensis]